MSSTRLKIRVLCGLSISMSLFFYLYWSYAVGIYDQYTIDLVNNNSSVRWFEFPTLVYDLWVPIAIGIYLMIALGWTILRHLLLVYIIAGILLGFSSESSCFTSLDIFFLDIWKMSDGALLYLLYFGSGSEK